MPKKNKKMLTESKDILKMKRLAGILKDDSDLDDYNLIRESSEIPGSPVTSPRPGSASEQGETTSVLKEEDEELEDEFSDDEEMDEFGEDDEEIGDDEELDGFGDHSEPVGNEGLAGGVDKMAIANALKVIGQALGITVEVEGEGSEVVSDQPAEEPVEELVEEPVQSGGDEFGAPAKDDELSDEQQKMLAEIFDKTAKEIFKNLKQKNKVVKK